MKRELYALMFLKELDKILKKAKINLSKTEAEDEETDDNNFLI